LGAGAATLKPDWAPTWRTASSSRAPFSFTTEPPGAVMRVSYLDRRGRAVRESARTWRAPFMIMLTIAHVIAGSKFRHFKPLADVCPLVSRQMAPRIAAAKPATINGFRESVTPACKRDVSVTNCCSSGDRCVDEAAAVYPPGELLQIGSSRNSAAVQTT
jgi:hypothetical protein